MSNVLFFLCYFQFIFRFFEKRRESIKEFGHNFGTIFISSLYYVYKYMPRIIYAEKTIYLYM